MTNKIITKNHFMKKNFLKILGVCSAVIFFSGKINAQLSGTVTVPGTYTSIAAAITDLNTQGVNGALFVDIAAGYTETAPAGGYSLTTIAGASSTNSITFQKSGAGANPLITAYTGVGTPTTPVQDGVWRFIGADYITVDGIDITDPNISNPATMEFGYGFFKASATNGCQNNTIKNCVITLNRVNNAAGGVTAVDGSRGIELVNATSSTHTLALTITSPAGSNSNNKFYSNTIQNCNMGIVMIGFADASPFLNADQNNDIGGTSSSTGNNIINFGGGGTATSAAIRTLAQYGINVSYNTINNNTGSGVNHAGTFRGIYLNTAVGANATVTNNTLTLKFGGTTAQVSVIENVSGATGAGNAITISDNVITNCTNSTATSSTFYGIYNTASTASLIVNNNAFSNNITNATSGSTSLIRNSGAVSQLMAINNNTLSHSWAGTTASGITYNIYSSSSALTCTATINNNSFQNYSHLNTGTGTFYFIYNTADYTNLSLISNKWDGLVMNHSSTEYLMYNSSSTQSLLTVVSNSLTNYSRTAGSGSLYFYYNISTSPAAVHVFSNNLVSNVTSTITGTGSFYGIYNSEGGTSPYPKKTVTSNTITNININGTGTFYGVYVPDLGDGNQGSGSAVYNNLVDNITWGGSMYGLYTSSPSSPSYAASIYSNTVTNLFSNGGTSTVYGSYVGSSSTGAGVNFYKNKISDITANGATGTTHGIYAVTTATSNIYNNLVGNLYAPNSTGANRVNGVYVSSGTNVNLSYNTVLVNATSTGVDFGTNAVYSSTTAGVSLRNNIFVNLSVANGTCITAAYRRGGISLATYSLNSNRNIFYAGTPAPKNVIFSDGTNDYQLLGTFISAVSPREAASLTENPTFVSTVGSNANFLNLSPTVPTQAESGASPIAGITDDYIGTTRNVTTPDIGAWEGSYVQSSDIAAPAMLADGFTSSACNLSSRTFTMNITDGSGVATGSLSPRVYYSVNGGPYTSTTGTLTAGNILNGVWTFSMSYTGALNDVITYFTVAQDIAPTPNLGAVPGAGFAGTDVNTVSSYPTSPNSYTLNAVLSGTYTVGTAGSYTTLTQAANAYNVSCLAGPVTFVLTDPSYSANETFPIIFMNNPDASSTNSLLVIPATGNAAAITGTSTASSTIKFLNARYITFDGLNSGGSSLAVDNPNTGTSAVIWLASAPATSQGNKYIAIKNMTLTAGASTSGKYGIIAGNESTNPTTTSGMDNDNVTISGNTILRTYYGIYATGTSSTTSGGLDNWSITGNTIGPVTIGTMDIGYRGMYLSNIVGLNVSGNTIQNILSTSSASGVYLNTGISGGVAVSQNTITNIQSSTASSAVTTIINGIYIGTNVSGAMVNMNQIYNVENTSGSGYGARGIIVNTGANTGTTSIQNNMIGGIAGNLDDLTTRWAYGITIEGTSSNVNVDFNTVDLSGSHPGTNTITATSCIYLNTTGSNINLRNNILSNTYDNISSSTDKAYAIYSSAASAANIASIDYNDYYVGGGAATALGYINSSNQVTLPAVQASFGGNMNSQNIMPVFTATNDLHLIPAMNAPIDNLGTTLAGITVDIDNQVRNITTPDIGADEFTAPTCTTADGGTITPAGINLCNGQALSISSTSVSTGANTVYQWMYSTTPGGPYSNVIGGSGANTAAYTSTALTTGTLYYVLQVGCTSASLTATSNEATVTINPVPTASITTSSTICAQQDLVLNGGSDIGTIYSWSGPNSFASSVQTPTITGISPSASGVYTLMVSTPNCSATAVTASVTVESVSLSIMAPAVSCSGSTSTLTAMSSASSFTWSTGANTNSIVVSPTVATIYTVAVTGTNNCVVTASTNLSVINPTITGFGAMTCGVPSTASLSAVSFSPSTINWYASPSTTVSLASGGTYLPPLAASTTTYYAEANGTGNDSLLTTLTSNNGAAGNMFDITALSNITINAFDMNINGTTTATVEVWYRTGSFVGFETSNAGWTQILTTTVTGMGSGNLTTVPSTLNLNVPAGQTYAFYVTTNGGPSVRYTNGTTLGSLYTSNADLQFFEGKGGGYFSVTNSPRVWNGQIRYTKAGCVSPRIPVTLTVTPFPTVTIAPTATTICLGSSITFTASGAQTYSWSSGATTSVTVESPTITTSYTVTGDSAGCSAMDTVSISVVVCTGVNGIASYNDVNVYPNPFRNVVNVVIENVSEKSVFEVYDALGRIVINLPLKDHQTIINTSELPGGVYSYRIKSSAEVIKQGKLIKD
jgi:hypothetical protein